MLVHLASARLSATRSKAISWTAEQADSYFSALEAALRDLGVWFFGELSDNGAQLRMKVSWGRREHEISKAWPIENLPTREVVAAQIRRVIEQVEARGATQ